MNRALLLRTIHAWLQSVGGSRPVIWTFLPTPLALDIHRALDSALLVYYCIDDLPSSSPGARRLAVSEECILREADLVFATTESLAVRARRLREGVHVFPFGVNLAEFSTPSAANAAPPPDLARIPEPRAGYVGSVGRKLDQDLLAAVASRMPDVSFVLIGGIEEDVSRLRRQPNIHCLGPRRHQELPDYLRGFDLGVIPYRRNEYTAHIYPAKLNEYLATGLPVVATKLPELQLFNQRYGCPVVHLCDDPAAFVRETRQALGETSSTEVARRVAVAEANDWAPRIGEMMALTAAALDRDRERDGRQDTRLPAT